MGVLATAGLLIALVMLVRDARAAQRSLDRAQTEASAVLAAVRHNDLGVAEARAERLRQDAAAAHSRTSGWLWVAAEHLPVLGRTPQSIATIASATAALSDRALPRLLDLQRQIAAHPLVHADRIDLPRMQSLAVSLDVTSRQLHAERLRVDRLDLAAVPGPVRRRVAAARNRLDGLDDRLSTATRVAAAAPALLGGQGQRRYLVVLQNNAEARGTGGVAGAYLVLAADAGHLHVVTSGSDDEFNRARAPVAELGPDYVDLYGDDPALWTNANLSPHFPDAARLWLADWQQVRHTRLDGVIATDPVTLGRLLAVTGPVRLPAFGDIRADNAVAVTERDAYVWFAHDNAARQRFLLAVLSRIVDRVLHFRGEEGPRLMWALGTAADTGRLLMYSTSPDGQQALSAVGWSGEIQTGSAPYLRLTINNAAGNKLDLYLHRQVSYHLGPCVAGVRDSTVAVSLTSAVPAGSLPAYVADRHDIRTSYGTPSGSNRLLVYLHLTAGAGLNDALLDGQRVAVHVGRERGHPVVTLAVDLDRGQTRTLVLHLLEPASKAAPIVAIQPLAVPQRTTLVVDSCREHG